MSLTRNENIELMELLQERNDRRFEANLKDRTWRLNNLYYVKDKAGEKVKFEMWAHQEYLLKHMHYNNIILKARQLGFTTFIQIFLLDACLFNNDVAAGVRAQTGDHAAKFFERIIKYAWDNIDPRIKDKMEVDSNAARTLKFGNGSSIEVGTHVGRSGTYQYLHISEYGKICQASPQQALEIRTGALNAVAKGQYVFIESSAEGQGGDFYDMTQTAKKLQDVNAELTDMDWKFFFFPWWKDTGYIQKGNVVYPDEMVKYFDELEEKGITLTRWQKNWYVKKKETQKGEMFREFPSTPDEPFHVAIQGSFFANTILSIRKKGHICPVPIEHGIPVNTFWDLGFDTTSIWFHQEIHGEHRFISYYENDDEGMAHYINIVDDFKINNGIVWGKHYGPHDLAKRSMSSLEKDKSMQAEYRKMGIEFEKIERTLDKQATIERGISALPNCWFHETNCSIGIARLENYKRTWNKQLQVWSKEPVHDLASHGSDAFLTFVDHYKNKPVKKLINHVKIRTATLF